MLRTNEVRPVVVPGVSAHAYPLFFQHLRQQWLIYVIGAFALVLCAFVEVMQPKIIQWILDLLSNNPIPAALHRGETKETFELLLLIFSSLLIIQWFARRYWRLSMGQETHHVASDFKSAVWERTRYFKSTRLTTELTKGTLMNIATGDVNSARLMFGWNLIGIIDTALLIVFSLTCMLLIDVQLTLLILASLLVLPFFGYKRAQQGLALYTHAQESLSELNELTAQAVATVKLQRLCQTERSWARQLFHAADAYRQRRLDEILTFVGFILTVGIPPIIGYAIIFTMGINRVDSGTLSLGEFIALQSYMFLVLYPLTEVGFLLAEWQKSIGSLKRLTSVLKEEPDLNLYSPERALQEIPESDSKQAVLCIEGLRFQYPGTEGPVLDDISISLTKGDRLGIVGPVGAGKSTLVQLIAGLDRSFEGSISLFGEDIRRYPSPLLRSFVSIVDQRPFLFADSVRNNVMLGRADYADEELMHYLAIAGLEKDVTSFPDGLDTELGEWGVNLSGGQKQRLTLARALASKPKLLLLDDCLSAVDTVTEERILTALDHHLKDTTLIWVAHRTSTLRYCNQILRLEA